MKLRNKAALPIGVIILVIVVAIAGFGIWWYMTRMDCGQYDDVVKSKIVGYDAYAHVDHPYADSTFVQIQYETDTRDWDLIWRMGNGAITARAGLSFGDVRTSINDNLVGDQKDTAMHIWNAIDKGCV